jgi:hypothetical protein
MYQQKNKIKAAFLLLVFALNTVVSFACSVGLVDFSEDHHKHGASHVHDKSHSHQGVSHQHEKSVDVDNHHHLNSTQQLPGEEENNCCSDDVVKVATLDKSVTSVNQNPLPLPVEVMAAIYAFILPGYYSAMLPVKPKLCFDRRWALTDDTDLRIVIQSFQI